MTRRKQSNSVLAGLAILTTLLASIKATVIDVSHEVGTWNPTVNQTSFDQEEETQSWL
jgi:hypothetical protein